MTRMKDSGIEWIGEVPEEWGIVRLKDCLEINNGKEYKDIETDETGYPVIGSGGQFAYARKYLHDGTAILLGRKGTIDKPLYIEGKFWTVDTMFYSVPKSGIHAKFIYYVALQIPFGLYSTNTALPSMTQTDLQNHHFVMPPLDEQTQIADFLDKKVAQLDEVKSLLEEQIKTLEDYRRSLIYETVTKGLDKTVPLKDSGVDWIGQIPEGWGITKFKYFLDTNKGLTITKENLIEDGIPVINYGQIHSKYGKSVNTDRDELPQVSANYLKFKQSLLKPGDFVFADTSEDIDGSGNFSTRIDDNGELFAGYHTIKAKLKNALEHDFRYFMHYFDSLAFRKQVQNKVSGIKVYSITQSILQETCLILPSLYEQQQIATFLDKKTEQINQMIAIKKEQIENINKQRQTLIYDYVTGKRRV